VFLIGLEKAELLGVCFDFSVVFVDKGRVLFVELIFFVDGFVELLFGGVEGNAKFVNLSSQFFN
jgi:hypothetical protein